MKIEIKILNKEWYISNDLLPEYQTLGSAAMDLRCTEDVTIYPGETKIVNTGLAFHIGSGVHRDVGEQYDQSDLSFAGLVIPRSGLGTAGLVLANTIGVIDEDYQGELKIAAWNRLNSRITTMTGKDIEHNKIFLKAGDRIAQLMFVPVIKAQWGVVDEFNNSTERGVSGFGSTGVF